MAQYDGNIITALVLFNGNVFSGPGIVTFFVPHGSCREMVGEDVGRTFNRTVESGVCIMCPTCGSASETCVKERPFIANGYTVRFGEKGSALRGSF